ncbi:cell wall-binding repeat-containing protein [Rathayibacter sp. SD072]|uniref:cell wall-binding repeat-containing protein n=1 Tax=Rathayibacter sp. SD072 TaxID=2781731 RepID=UPI001A95F60C|nr:cell wall-binding repeat-containing protein [Rathayibacter sp. SD072]MBO0983943.1 cell wall-binding repeat-containing protein [Rathayibacter sp. SD072]
MGNHRRPSRLLTAVLAVAVGLGTALVPVTAASAAEDVLPPASVLVDPGTSDASVSVADEEPGDVKVQYAAESTKSFRAGFIFSDANFFDSDAKTVAQIQATLDDKGRNCSGTPNGVPCLKAFSQATPTKAADPMCKEYRGSARESAATIFVRVGEACGINPLVLTVLVQKETSLVSTTSPTERLYNRATGFNCPDETGCNNGSAGFFTQVYGAARQFKKYANPPGSDQNFTAYAAGTPPSILFNPDRSCGSTQVAIRNQATANLYYYTPYQPNDYALTNTGNQACATYGNINFWYIFSDWNGSLANAGVAPAGRVDTPRISGGTLTAAGWTVDPTTQRAALTTTVTITAPDGSKTVRTATANGARSDIPGEYPAAGPNHGFTVSAPASAVGTYTVCVSAASVEWNRWVGTGDSRGPGSKDLGCSTVSSQGAIAVDRLAGTDRQETAVKVSQSTFKAGVPVVYVATGTGFADALSAGPAAAKQGGPLLLVDRDSMTQPVRDELSRLKPAKIVVVGSALSVSEALKNDLARYAGSIQRIGGSDRYDTSKKIIEYAFPQGSSQAWMATGEKFPDALSAGAVAGSVDAPVILVRGGQPTADETTKSLLTRLGVKTLTIAGSAQSVSEGIKNSLPVASTRIGGSSRYETSEKLNSAGFPRGASTVYFATGENYPDALSGATAAGYTSSPLFAVRKDCVPQPVLDYVNRFATKRIVLLGGPGTLSESVARLVSCG